MRLFAAVLAVAVALAFAPFVQAGHKALAAGAKGHDHPVRGKVVKVEGSTLTIQVKHKGETTERQIQTNNSTKVTLDGKDVKLADLKAGERVTVTLANEMATNVSAVTHSGKKHTAAASAGAAAK